MQTTCMMELWKNVPCHSTISKQSTQISSRSCRHQTTRTTGSLLKLTYTTLASSHDGHEDFPLAPTKERIHYKSLSEWQQKLLEEMGEKRLYSQGKKPHSVSEQQKELYGPLHITLKLVCQFGDGS